ncbi:FecR domain-containing protein [Pararhodobacter marinus]|uniref:FecR domain-containing protein n=1 Tax=Pararhodobacter marinus TaxID=2184063 RepID=UPI003511F54C
MPFITRRHVLAAAATLPLLRMAHASTGAEIGEVLSVTGDRMLERDAQELALETGAGLMNGDTASTGEDGLALLYLNRDTRINLGINSRIELSNFLSEVGGVIHVGGAMIFDRPDDMPPLDLRVVTAFGEIGVRGTRFFVGPSADDYAVFVQRGSLTVSNADVTRTLNAGEGCVLQDGAAPGVVTQWSSPRIDAAFASLGATPTGEPLDEAPGNE